MNQMSSLLPHVVEIRQRAEADACEGGESGPLELRGAGEDHGEDISLREKRSAYIEYRRRLRRALEEVKNVLQAELKRHARARRISFGSNGVKIGNELTCYSCEDGFGEWSVAL